MTDLSKPDAFDTQIGGDHYRRWGYQPFEFAMVNGLNPAQTKIIKYVMRHDVKGGAEDIRKALHVCYLWITLHQKVPHRADRDRECFGRAVEDFQWVNASLGKRERDIVALACSAVGQTDIRRVIAALTDLLLSAYPAWASL